MKKIYTILLFTFNCYLPAQSLPLTPFVCDTTSADQYFDYALNLSESETETKNIYFNTAKQCYTKMKMWEAVLDCELRLIELLDNRKKAIVYLDSLLLKMNKLLPPDNPYLGEGYFILGTYLMKNNNSPKKISTSLEMSIGILSKNQDDISQKFLVVSYNNIGKLYRNLGDYIKAIQYYYKALKIIENNDILQLYQQPIYNNIGIAYEAMKDYPNALAYYQKSILLEKDIILYNSLATTHQNINKYDTAYTYIQKALQLIKTNPSSENLELIYSTLGWNYFKQKNYTAALDTLQLALANSLQAYGSKHTAVATALHQIGRVHFAQKNYLKALTHFQKALAAFLPNFHPPTNSFNNPVLSQTAFYHYDILKNIRYKADAQFHYYQETKNRAYLNAAFRTYQLADSLMVQMRQSYFHEDSKFALEEESISVYEGAIATALALYELNQEEKYQGMAFQFAQKSKANVLLEVLQDRKAQFNNVPDSVIAQIRIWETEKNYYGKLLYKEQIKNEKKQDHLIQQYQNQLFQINEQLDTYTKMVERRYPNYYQLKYQLPAYGLAAVRTYLSSKNALLEFFVGQKTIYLFTVRQHELYIDRVPKTKKLSHTIAQFHQYLKTPSFNKKKGDSIGHQLYQQLFANTLTPLQQNNINFDELIIVPQDSLSLLPFEALVHTNPQQEKEDAWEIYLTVPYTISYRYFSPPTPLPLKQKKQPSTTQYVGFAPHYDPLTQKVVQQQQQQQDIIASSAKQASSLTMGNYADLPNARQSVKTTANNLKGHAFTSKRATKNTFLTEAPNYNIVHIAAHGEFNDTHPLQSRFIFSAIDDSSDVFLTVSDLYNMTLSADLVFLTACETGIGEIKQGEGMISLSRAFAYAGCPSIGMSLWKIDSKKYTTLSTNFFRYIQQGMRKDKALQKAKIDYLSAGIPSNQQHPYYWAGMIMIGETSSIYPKHWSPSFIFTIVILLLPFIFIVYYWHYRKKHN